MQQCFFRILIIVFVSNVHKQPHDDDANGDAFILNILTKCTFYGILQQ